MELARRHEMKRMLGYDVQAEVVDTQGNFVRPSSEFSWENRGNPNEGEWLTFRGNVIYHFEGCAKISMNQT